MINLTDEMVSRLDSALADEYSCLVGTASKDGEPQISPKGSMMAFDRDTLAYWERAKRSALDNVAENPQVVVYYAQVEWPKPRIFQMTVMPTDPENKQRTSGRIENTKKRKNSTRQQDTAKQ